MKRTGFISTALLATYLVAWLSLGPVLSLCRCVEGHTALTSRVHEAPACGHHHHSHEHDEPEAPVSQPEHSCDDTPVISGELAVQKNGDASAMLVSQVALLPAPLQPDSITSLVAAFDPASTHGPPRDLARSLRATILLI